MPSPEKFRKTLDDFHVEQEIIDEMYRGFDILTSKTNKKIKSAFFTQALKVMNEKLPPEKVREIFEANACCKSGAREKNSREIAKTYAGLDIADRLKLISMRPYLNMGSAELDEDGFLLVHAVSYHPGDKYECVCPTVSKIKRDCAIPREYCCCCGGHFKYHYEIMLGVKLKPVEIVSSPHDTDGEKPCAFRYYIQDAQLPAGNPGNKNFCIGSPIVLS
ncbi:MAG: hypothetical protein GXY20_01495 [Clostridiales bacterium]|nr:hypothetical protein [Clostridiales bacterium]